MYTQWFLSPQYVVLYDAKLAVEVGCQTDDTFKGFFLQRFYF